MRADPTSNPPPAPPSRRAGARRSQAPEITSNVKQEWRQRREDYSAGGVAYRPLDEGGAGVAGGYEAALIATRGGTRWQLPKGTREPGETPEQTAIREVEEEVGLQTVSEGFLRAVEYWYWDTYQRSVPELVHKRVDFFLLRVVGGALSDDCFEVDATGWFTLEQAQQVLTFRGEQEVLRAAIAALARR
jgi:8-oxo-dGTP pyrophosphatase MutT (NUDIX family)